VIPENIPKSLGRYEIRTVIGRGMMGVVYEAVDPALGRTVALKTIQLAFGISDQERQVFEERFFTEARLAAGLSHPNIVVVHDVGWDEPSGTPFMALEFLHGVTLSERLDAEEPMDWRESLRIAARVADALHVAHQAGVVHRDIKPANIMLLPSGEPKIMDFGIAKAPTSQLTAAGDVFGTPSYMSPEQATGTDVDGRSDIFSLGTILYQMLTGQRAFDAPNVPAIMARVTHEAPESPLALVPGLPPDVERLMARCLAKSPGQRYRDGRNLAEDLEDILSGVPLRDRPGLARALGEPAAPTINRLAVLANRTDASGASPDTLARTATASFVDSGKRRPAQSSPPRAPSAVGPVVVLTGLVAIAAIAGTAAVLAVRGVESGRGVMSASMGVPGATAPASSTLPAVGPVTTLAVPPPRAISANAPPRSAPKPAARPRSTPTPRPVPTPVPTPAPTPTPASIAAPPVSTVPVGPPPARLMVRVDHSLPSAVFRVRALPDGPGSRGRIVLSRRLTGQEEKRLGIFKSHRGELQTTVDVPAGEYYMRVEAERDGKVVRAMIRGEFRSGRTSILDVRVRGGGVELRWD
jgi:eukaryotic-like serine/threonine-protein kinase